MQTLQRLVNDTSGTSNAEYVLILAITGTAILISAIWFGGVVGDATNETGKCIEMSGSTCDQP